MRQIIIIILFSSSINAQIIQVAGGGSSGGGGITTETDPTVQANVKDGVSWSELSGIPPGFADGTDDVGTGGGSADGVVTAFVTNTSINKTVQRSLGGDLTFALMPDFGASAQVLATDGLGSFYWKDDAVSGGSGVDGVVNGISIANGDILTLARSNGLSNLTQSLAAYKDNTDSQTLSSSQGGTLNAHILLAISGGNTYEIQDGPGIILTNTGPNSFLIESSVVDTERSDEEIQGVAGGMFSNNTETGVSAIYRDVDGTVDLELDNEYIQDNIAAMITGGVQNDMTVTYDDNNGEIDFNLSDNISAISLVLSNSITTNTITSGIDRVTFAKPAKLYTSNQEPYTCISTEWGSIYYDTSLHTVRVCSNNGTSDAWRSWSFQ